MKKLLLFFAILLANLSYAQNYASTKDCDELLEKYQVLAIAKLSIENELKGRDLDLHNSKIRYKRHLIYTITGSIVASLVFFIISIISVVFLVINREKYKKLLSEQP